MKQLFEFLAQYGGTIESTASLSVEDINQAKASGRMWVDENSLGFVWMPKVTLLPTTEEEVELFEKWFPLQVELPEELKDPSFLWDESKRIKNNNPESPSPLHEQEDELWKEAYQIFHDADPYTNGLKSGFDRLKQSFTIKRREQ